ncbi:MAG: hypothetical protein HQ581_25360 [Planctomycetes bacterium]|nr:hypothetical protein [Planctomycetota bacterium]
MVLDFPDRVARIRQFVDELERASGQRAVGQMGDNSDSIRVAQFSPQFVTAASLKTAVETIISAEGRVAVMDPENKLVIADYLSRIQLAQQLIEELDVPRQQIRVTAMIYDLAVKDIERLGINWNSALKNRHDAEGNPQSSWNINSFLSVPVNTVWPAERWPL